MVWHNSKRAPGRRVKTGFLSEKNVSSNRRSSKISDYQAIIDVFLLNYAVMVNLDEARGTKKMGPKKIPRACGLVNYLLTVSRCSSWHCRLHSCPVWANNRADSFRPLLQGTKKHKEIDTWYLTWIRMVCFWVKSHLTHVLSRWVGYCGMRTATHTCLPVCNDWGLTVTRSLSVMTQLKHDHDTQP